MYWWHSVHTPKVSPANNEINSPAASKVTVKERTPVAFVAIGERVELIDSHGVLMEIPPGAETDYSFPVILGMSDNEPLPARALKMNTFMRLMQEARGGSGPILLHLGNENFFQRFMVFLSNVQKWERERGKLESVDLRYGREVILNPDMSRTLAESRCGYRKLVDFRYPFI